MAALAKGSNDDTHIKATNIKAAFLIPKVLRSMGGPLGTVRSSISILWVLDRYTRYQNCISQEALEATGLRCREPDSGRNSSVR